MSNRLDSKKRKLNTNEYQAADGRYIYQYTDQTGKTRRAYSWCLTTSDKPPKGKKCPACLREMEKEIEQKLNEGIEISKSKKLTIDDLFEDRIKFSKIKKESVEINYRYLYTKYIQPVFGSRKIETIKEREILAFYEDELVKKCGFNPSSVGNVHTVLSPVFTRGIKERAITINPCLDAWAQFVVIHSEQLDKNTSTRHALEEAQQSAFMNYVKDNRKQYEAWYNLLVVFLGTGCRVGELLGLTWNDIDFKNGIIKIDHQLQYRPDKEGHSTKKILPPKSKNSRREIAMYDAVRTALLNEKQRHMKLGLFCKESVSGYIMGEKGKKIDVTLSDFVFLNRYGMAQIPTNTNKAFERIRRDYNQYEMEQAKKERRTPIEMPHFTNHVLRHTFCTRHCEIDDIDLAVLADTFGDDIKTMMNVYNEVQREHKKKTIAKLEGKVLIG